MIGLQIIMTIFGLPFSKEPLAVRNHFVYSEILLQILGVIGYGMFILSRMHYVTISYIWGVFCLLPFAISILSLIFKSISYRKYSLLNYSEDPHRNQ